MTIRFRCQSCQTFITAPADRVGQRTKCPKCGQPIEVPAAAAEPATVTLPENREAPVWRQYRLDLIVVGVVALVVGVVIGAWGWPRGPGPGQGGAGGKATVQGGGGGVVLPAGVLATDPEVAEFVELVRRNADDPAGLEIVEWGERKGGTRQVKFRCQRIGSTQASGGGSIEMKGKRIYSPVDPGGVPVPIDTATIVYDGGKIGEVCCDKCGVRWMAQR